MVKKISRAFALLLLILCVASIPSVVATKAWNVETPWEKKKAAPYHKHDEVPEDAAAWPLFVPRRKEKTVVLRFSYGERSKRRLNADTTEDEGIELSVAVTYEELCKYKFQKFIMTSSTH
jgi:hypothetical protein